MQIACAMGMSSGEQLAISVASGLAPGGVSPADGLCNGQFLWRQPACLVMCGHPCSGLERASARD